MVPGNTTLMADIVVLLEQNVLEVDTVLEKSTGLAKNIGRLESSNLLEGTGWIAGIDCCQDTQALAAEIGLGLCMRLSERDPKMRQRLPGVHGYASMLSFESTQSYWYPPDCCMVVH